MVSTMPGGHEPGLQAADGGGFTPAPRWARSPGSGVAEHVAALSEALTAALRGRARALGVPFTAVLLAAHLKVLSVLSGDTLVRTGFLPPAGTVPLPLEVSVAPGTWRRLVLGAHRAEAAAPPAAGPAAPGPEVVFDRSGREPAVPSGSTLLHVSAGVEDGRCVLRLRHRADVLDADCAGRIGGYHVTALERIAADPDARHDRCSLVSADEVRYQLDELAGPERVLPDRRVHELFEERVRRRPDAVAVVHRDRSWTYRELDVRADRIARGLLAEGLGPEGVVAVVTERDLGWTAAVLGVLKAGGAYLPVDPRWPVERVSTVLARSGCAHVLTAPGSTANLEPALAALPTRVRTVLVPDLTERSGAPAPAPVEVGAGQLAYVFFTSGSTGVPKGAMCEQAGLLNHLCAKIDDLRLDEDSVVAQTASQCFDISLWQLLAPLLAGGRTLLVGQDAVLDAERFLDTVTEGRATVLQVVPSYLDVLLTALERSPRALPHLRCVSVTGEAVRSGLVRRWFSTGPGVRLVNAYGLTETCDDTNHEVMDRAPDSGRVPLGRPVSNVRVRVVDDRLVPVPLGAPGAIVFSGICVGRGYVNDPERTSDAFPPDPRRPGRRLFVSGDFGRWLPDGKLDYLGRRDAQVKVRGFRVEIGEIENMLLRVPGVRDGAVVVTGPEGHGRLSAFCAGGRILTEEYLRGRLARLLPAYLVPESFHRVDALPRTANGKTDRKALTALADGAGGAEDTCPGPRTPAERRIATAWATVLGTDADRIGRDESFFELGGTSLSAVRLAVLLDRAISPRDLTAHPTLADLARLIDTRAGTASAAKDAGNAPRAAAPPAET